MSDRPDVSVVCSTYQRAHKLPGLVEALEAQTYDKSRFEVVLVDNGSTDNTFAVLEELAARATIDLRVVRVEVNRGPSKGRNTGWRMARAPLIAFTDDDCIPTPRWLEVGTAVATDGGPKVVVGRTKPNPDQSANVGPFSRTQNITSTRHMQTCNIFYARDDLETVNGLDEKIAAKGGEDTDLAWRIMDRGREVEFAEDALVFHDISPSSFRSALKEAATWVDIPRVKVMHPERAGRLLKYNVFWKQSHPPALVATIGIVAALVTRRPVLLVSVLPWVRFRMRVSPLGKGRRQALALLPAAFAIDTVEISTMIRGSVKHRTLVL